ncbi:MAG TPA: helix-turn-helix domain-containing protein [Ktedonobacteraceae bacterium]|jgi:AcrR family transcriptional regulator
MNRPDGQSSWTNTKRDASTPTRQRLLDAAAELIAECGWGQVTTRAIAERASLPHGTVSYHFQGKQELLTEAALHATSTEPGGKVRRVRLPPREGKKQRDRRETNR